MLTFVLYSFLHIKIALGPKPPTIFGYGFAKDPPVGDQNRHDKTWDDIHALKKASYSKTWRVYVGTNQN